jgi:hypothetical protein
MARTATVVPRLTIAAKVSGGILQAYLTTTGHNKQKETKPVTNTSTIIITLHTLTYDSFSDIDMTNSFIA